MMLLLELAKDESEDEHQVVNLKKYKKIFSLVIDEKLDSLNLEYTYLLTTQLESQRLYFEDKMSLLENDAVERIKILEERLKKTMDDFQALELRLKDTEKDKKCVEKKYSQVVSRVGNLVSELKEEREMNLCLRDNQKVLQQNLEGMNAKFKELENLKNQEVLDLQEQIQDLMRHLETQAAIASAPDSTQKEIQEGQVFLQVSPQSSKTPPHQKSRTRKK